ncbi:hypothetical protein [Rubellimicrobium roseum]|uniref:VPLPA-CTERM sorting domain-containing protein n=1 Tax=Rubellimicrobium roseum TaxID=687525 RepID=A0A5C4N7W9_9RHOB|nr:hypothetical protein [Rubellimicrobium roseum]TNC59859.1 hypothetical protein FHG71_22470 [Rubellimicrobium roseum]
MKAWLGAAALVTMACAAEAATITWADLTGGGEDPLEPLTYTEDGITADSGGRSFYWGPGVVSDSIFNAPRAIAFTMTGRFAAVSADLYGSEIGPWLAPDAWIGLATGWRDGVEVARLAFDTRVTGSLVFSGDFSHLDRLVLGLNPDMLGGCDAGDLHPGGVCAGYGVGTVTLDPVDAPAPIPLPASAALLGLALAGLGVAHIRRTR